MSMKKKTVFSKMKNKYKFKGLKYKAYVSATTY